MSQIKIAVLVGSLRADSFNRRLARAVEKLAPDDFAFRHLQLNDLPLYSQDFDAAYPATATRLKKDVEGADGLLYGITSAGKKSPFGSAFRMGQDGNDVKRIYVYLYPAAFSMERGCGTFHTVLPTTDGQLRAQRHSAGPQQVVRLRRIDAARNAGLHFRAPGQCKLWRRCSRRRPLRKLPCRTGCAIGSHDLLPQA